jgi:hypothetical protein
LASFDTAVLAFECVFSNLTSAAVYSLRIFFFAAFFATAISKFDSGNFGIRDLVQPQANECEHLQEIRSVHYDVAAFAAMFAHSSKQQNAVSSAVKVGAY